MTSDIMKQWEKMNEEESPGKLNPRPEIPKNMRVAARQKAEGIKRPEYMDKKETSKKSMIPSKLLQKLSNKKVIKTGNRATLTMPERRMGSFLTKHNSYFS